MATVATLFLTLGYAASQYSYFNGSIVDYTGRMESSPVRTLATLLLVAIVVLSIAGERAEEES